jgi:glucose-1-phosphate adenylyltransferase
MPENTICLILAGGIGSRLHPLTAERAKPAVPFGGRYRIIDFTLSNCLHSGLRRILVLTQYKSLSLQQHLRDGWSIYNAELGEYITPVPPQMRTGGSWYRGTADAIYQNLYLLERSGAQDALILSGDHIYRMDYAAMLQHHRDCRAESTVACLTVGIEQAGSVGVMAVDEGDRIVSFQEKPTHPRSIPGDAEHVLASMGVYVFSMPLLVELLRQDHEGDSTHDFGTDILPSIVGAHRVIAYRFGGVRGRVTADRYWRDVGTIDAYYEANMDLLRPLPQIDLYQKDWPIRTYEGQHPPARSVPGGSGREAEIVNCMLASGTLVIGGTVRHSILFPNVRVEEGAVVENSLLFHGVTVGDGAQLQRCIVDKHVTIPAGERIGFDRACDATRFTVSDNGIVVVPKEYRFN